MWGGRGPELLLHDAQGPVWPASGPGPLQVAREIRLHAELAHDSIIAMYAAWKDRSFVYMALEWAPGVRMRVCVRKGGRGGGAGVCKYCRHLVALILLSQRGSR